MRKFLDEKPVEMSFPKKNGVFIPLLGCLMSGRGQKTGKNDEISVFFKKWVDKHFFSPGAKKAYAILVAEIISQLGRYTQSFKVT